MLCTIRGVKFNKGEYLNRYNRIVPYSHVLLYVTYKSADKNILGEAVREIKLPRNSFPVALNDDDISQLVNVEVDILTEIKKDNYGNDYLDFIGVRL